jgi:hypothetical protein
VANLKKSRSHQKGECTFKFHCGGRNKAQDFRINSGIERPSGTSGNGEALRQIPDVLNVGVAFVSSRQKAVVPLKSFYFEPATISISVHFCEIRLAFNCCRISLSIFHCQTELFGIPHDTKPDFTSRVTRTH